MTEAIKTIVARFDALDAGDIGIFLCSDGTVGARIPAVNVRSEHTCAGLTGYGETADEAIAALWQAVLDIDTGRDVVLVRVNGDRRCYSWNGAAWKPDNRYPGPTP